MQKIEQVDQHMSQQDHFMLLQQDVMETLLSYLLQDYPPKHIHVVSYQWRTAITICQLSAKLICSSIHFTVLTSTQFDVIFTLSEL